MRFGITFQREFSLLDGKPRDPAHPPAASLEQQKQKPKRGKAA